MEVSLARIRETGLRVLGGSWFSQMKGLKIDTVPGHSDKIAYTAQDWTLKLKRPLRNLVRASPAVAVSHQRLIGRDLERFSLSS